MNNEQILENLLKGDKYEAAKCIEAINNWNKEESDFPIEELNKYIRFDRWKYSEFNFENEMIIKDFFPQFVLDIFFAVKEFKKNSRNELLYDQETFAQLYNMPVSSQDEKAKVVYDFAFQRYFENSKIVMKENE